MREHSVEPPSFLVILSQENAPKPPYLSLGLDGFNMV